MHRKAFNTGWETRPKANFFAEMVGGAPSWQPVTLPHDATIGQQRDAANGPASGYFPGGVYEYRKTFPVPADYRDKHVELEFEGVYRGATVFVNGNLIGQWAAGYSGFTLPLNDHLRFDADNEIRVECRSHKDSRWYAGAGIHRPVYLNVAALTRIPIGGVRVTTLDLDDDLAVVEVVAAVQNSGRDLATLHLRTELRDGEGNVVATDATPVTVPGADSVISRQRLVISNPSKWSLDSPSLYSAFLSVIAGESTVDESQVTFGVRTLQLDPQRGLRINGEPVKLRGACIHSDNGVIGSAAIARADERRVQLLKSAGFNALRSSHNPMSDAMLDACDRFGVLVMDESFDMWTESKSDFDYALDFAQSWERDIEAMVRKDINHPSVFCYSIGNEIPELGRPGGAVWSRRLAEKVRSLDDTRFVTNGVNGMLAVINEVMAEKAKQAGGEGKGGGINTAMTDMAAFQDEIGRSDLVTERTAEAFAVLDVAGMNYLDGRYERDRELFPQRVIVGTETFPMRIDSLWRLVLDNNHVIGDFTWTGWDYLGEAGIGRVADADDPTAGAFGAPYPWLLAWTGDLDITGHRRPASYYREIVFGLRTDPYMAVQRPERSGRKTVSTPWAWTDSIGSWSWNGAEGTPLTVEVYADADEVELLLNGRSLGTAPVGEKHRFRAEFQVPYASGELTAVGTIDGRESGRQSLRSATGAVKLSATADRLEIRSDETDLAYVEIVLQDSAGNVFIGQDCAVAISLTGPAVLQGFGSAAPCTEESYLNDVHTTFDGRVLAVIRPTGRGEISLTATVSGTEPVTVTITSK